MKQPKFKAGDDVCYFRRGICYVATVRQDLGILKGAGQRYRITPRDGDNTLDYFVFDVAERHLCTDEEDYTSGLDSFNGGVANPEGTFFL